MNSSRFTSAALVASLFALLFALAVTPGVDAAGGGAKGAAPLWRVDPLASGRGAIAASVKGSGAVSVTFSVANLPGSVTGPLAVWREDGVNLGSFTQVASIDAIAGGAGQVVLASSQGVPPELLVSDVADLVDRLVQIRDGGDTLLLLGKFPALEKFVPGKFTTKLVPPEGAALPNAKGKITGGGVSKLGSEKFVLTTKGLSAGTTYTLYLEDGADSGVFVAVGDLDGDHLVRDQAAGDPLPLSVWRLSDLIGRAVEVRDGATVVLQGHIPKFGIALQWPQDHVMILDVLGSTTDRYIRYEPGYILYRPEVDLKETKIGVLRSKGSGALWRMDLVGVVNDGIIVTLRLADNERYWWSVGQTNDPGSGALQHILVQHNGLGPPPNPDQVRFILHDRPRVGGKKAVWIESALFRGEYLVNEGHGLAANGIRFFAGAPDTFVVR